MVDVLRIKRRTSGAPGAPGALANAELAYNEVDNVLYYGAGGSAGAASSMLPIAGSGAFLPLSGGTLTGALTIGVAPQNRLTITPGAAAGNYIQLSASGSVGIQMPQLLFPATTTPIMFGDPNQSIAYGGADATSMSGTNLTLRSWNGIGFGTSNGAGQMVPAGMNAMWLGSRQGNLNLLGNLMTFNTTSASYLGALGFRKPGAQQQIYLDANANYVSAFAIAAGGSGISVNDRFYDAYNNTYTVTAVSAGAATTITMQTANALIGTPPANPVALTAAPGFSGTGLTVNLTWTQPTILAIGNYVTNGVLQLIGANIGMFTNASATGGLYVMPNTTGGWNTLAQAGDHFIMSNGGSVGAGVLTIAPWSNTTCGIRIHAPTNTVTLAGSSLVANAPATLNSGASFGSQFAGGVTDLSKHLALYSTTVGLSVISNRLNYVVPSGSSHFFNVGGTDIAQINNAGLTVTGTVSSTGNSTLSTAVANPSLTLGNNTATSLALSLNAAAGVSRYIQWRSAGTSRWMMAADNVAEGGSNAGSNFGLYRYADDGSFLGTAINVRRSDGQVQFNDTGGITIAGPTTHTGPIAVVPTTAPLVVAPAGATGIPAWQTDTMLGIARAGAALGLNLIATAGAPLLRGQAGEGNFAAPTATAANRVLLGLEAGGYDPTNGWVSNRANIYLMAHQLWASGNTPTAIAFKVTPVGSGTPLEAMRIAPDLTLLVAKTTSAGLFDLECGNGAWIPRVNVGALSTGPNISGGAGAASGTQPAGSIWMRTDGTTGSRLYVSAGGGVWNAVAGV